VAETGKKLLKSVSETEKPLFLTLAGSEQILLNSGRAEKSYPLQTLQRCFLIASKAEKPLFDGWRRPKNNSLREWQRMKPLISAVAEAEKPLLSPETWRPFFLG
jgi:hypothetical protein